MACPSRFRTLNTAFSSLLRHNASNSVITPPVVLTCNRTFQTTRPTTNDTVLDFSSILSRPQIPKAKPGKEESILQSFDTIFNSGSLEPEKDEYHLHIYSTKHNTHITFTDPDKNPIISVSAGNLGFKKAQRGTYDAAYQLASHVFAKLEEKNIHPRNMEVVLRDFGEGREAVLKALLGTEGRFLKGAIRRVTDATRLKFGGTRSKKPRRLG